MSDRPAVCHVSSSVRLVRTVSNLCLALYKSGSLHRKVRIRRVHSSTPCHRQPSMDRHVFRLEVPALHGTLSRLTVSSRPDSVTLFYRLPSSNSRRDFLPKFLRLDLARASPLCLVVDGSAGYVRQSFSLVLTHGYLVDFLGALRRDTWCDCSSGDA